MEIDDEEPQRIHPFQLQFDKPIPSQIKLAEWNPEKDLLAMVTEDSKLLLHRFNWQRLWTVSPGKCITSICWRPDGKAIALGLEDGTISLHDVENGKLLRSIKSHAAAVICLNWEEDEEMTMDETSNISTYEDRTPRFFPPPPRVPRIPGLVPGDNGFMDDSEDSFYQISSSSHQRFNILCSGDKDGSICFSIFGIFPVGRINVHGISVCSPILGEGVTFQLLNASICKVALSKNLCQLTVTCSGELSETDHKQTYGKDLYGFHCLVLDTSIFWKRKNELHQVSQQASNIEDLSEVIRASLSIMSKMWSDAMHTFHQKFDTLSNLIYDHGIDSTPQEEFLSLLGGARTSPPIHQFLVNSLGEAGLKRVAKVVCSAGKELQSIVVDHLQPAAEIIGFRIGELKGLSKWRARFGSIGLDEKLIDNAAEKAGMLLVQVERYIRVLSSVVQLFSNFFGWLLKSVKLLMSEPSDQLLPFNSEIVIIFLKLLYDQDPIRQLLEIPEVGHNIEVDMATMDRIRELTQFGGFMDTGYLNRTLAEEFQQMESCFKEAFDMPFVTISRKILCRDLLPVFPVVANPTSKVHSIPASISYYKEALSVSDHYPCHQSVTAYIFFRIPDESFSDFTNCVGIVRGFSNDLNSSEKGPILLEAALLCVPNGYQCVDLSLYKDGQLVLLLDKIGNSSESSENACMMIVQAGELPFKSISESAGLTCWKLQELKEDIIFLQLENEKVRGIPHSVVAPLAVSASRGLACVFAARKRVLVYILDEDEDELSDAE